MTPRLLTPLLLAAAFAPSALAQHATTEYGIDFVTVGDPGNRAPTSDEVPQRPWLSFGSVDQTFRIARTTTTATQWLQFIGAYAPLNGNPTDINFTSNLISPDYTGNYYIRSPEIVNFPVEVSFLYAARYCNWLHNGKVNDAWAFESGAYDMSTFGINPETGHFEGDPARSPDARYWIPTADEWVKAFYYDENRYANGDGGYWLYPHGSNEPPVTGYPEDGGETNAGEEPYVTPLLPVGSYPNAASPWGALDASGQVREWTSSPRSDLSGQAEEYLRLLQVGSSAGFPYPWLYDRLDYQAYQAASPGFGRGFRIATTIPAPASAVPILVAWCVLGRRGRHEPSVHRMCSCTVKRRPAQTRLPLLAPILLTPILLAAAFAPSAIAQHATTEYGIDFVTVVDPGNAPVPPELFEIFDPQPWGSVGYEYRIARTELSLGQWHEFVNAYLPHYQGPKVNPAFTSFGLSIFFGDVVYDHGYQSDHPADMSWEFAARYCNWLHNGKVNEAWAFESGAYETSTFYDDENGDAQHQVTHNPDAKYWIPTHDEWVKAAHYDPDRYGTGQGGYWIYPNASDEPLIPGPPEDGGETNAGFQTPRTLIGAYPDVQSPWGLLDVSGGVREWTEGLRSTSVGSRITRGTAAGDSFPELWDRVDYDRTALVVAPNSKVGLRIATTVPSPATACPLVGLIYLTARKRKET